MPPRASDPPRGFRGGATDPSIDPTVAPRGAVRGGSQSRSGISDARRYTPRGRSLREADADRGQSRRGGDPFRPALQVVQGGADERVRGGAAVRTRGRSSAQATAAPPAGVRRTPRAEPAAGRPHAPARSGGAGGIRAAARATAQPKRGAPVRRPKRQVRLPEPRRRLRLASVLILALFVAISGRLVELQLIDAKAYASRGLVNRIQRVELPAPRGTIYDRDRNILAHSVEARLVYGDPGMVVDPQATARQLAPLLGKPVSELLPKLVKHTYKDGTPVRFEYLARGVDVAVGDKVDALKLPGIVVNDDERRDVPGHDLAANLIGFTGHDLRGAAGLEFQYDDVLRGYRVSGASRPAPGTSRPRSPAGTGWRSRRSRVRRCS